MTMTRKYGLTNVVPIRLINKKCEEIPRVVIYSLLAPEASTHEAVVVARELLALLLVLRLSAAHS
jgi:hypothetical protein